MNLAKKNTKKMMNEVKKNKGRMKSDEYILFRRGKFCIKVVGLSHMREPVWIMIMVLIGVMIFYLLLS